MAYSVVQTAKNGSSNDPNVSVTFPSVCTAGNLIILMCAAGQASGFSSTGFTQVILADGGAALYHSMLYKISDGTEQTISTSSTSSGGTADPSVYALEISGVTGVTLDDSANDTTNISNTSATSTGTGTAAATTADGFAIIGWAGYRTGTFGGDDVPPAPSGWDRYAGGGARAGDWTQSGGLFYRDYTSTGNYSETLSISTGQQTAAILLFKRPAASATVTLSSPTATATGTTTATVGCTVTYT